MSNQGRYEDAIDLTASEADGTQLKHSDIRIAELGRLRVVGELASRSIRNPPPIVLLFPYATTDTHSDGLWSVPVQCGRGAEFFSAFVSGGKADEYH